MIKKFFLNEIIYICKKILHMKILFTLIIFIGIGYMVYSQSSFVVLNQQGEDITGQTIVIPVSINGSASYIIKVKNESSSTVSAKIYKNYIEGPANGSFDSMCSPTTQSSTGSCVTSSQTPTFVLQANEISGEAEMHYEHGSLPGVTTIRYKVTNVNNADDFVNVILSFSTQTTVIGYQIPDFAVYPNPAVNNFYIETPFNNLKKYRLEVFDVLGKQIFKSEIYSGKNLIDCSKWEKGYYFVRLYNETKLEKTIKLVVTR